MMNKLIFIASAFCVINAFKLDFKKSGKLVQNEFPNITLSFAL